MHWGEAQNRVSSNQLEIILVNSPCEAKQSTAERTLLAPGLVPGSCGSWRLRALPLPSLPDTGELVAKWTVSLQSRTETHLKTGAKATVQKRTIPTLEMPLCYLRP